MSIGLEGAQTWPTGRGGARPRGESNGLRSEKGCSRAGGWESFEEQIDGPWERRACCPLSPKRSGYL